MAVAMRAGGMPWGRPGHAWMAPAALGFLALAAGLVTLRRAPIDGWSLSVLDGVPPAGPACLLAAAAAGVALALSRRPAAQASGVVLVALASLAVVLAPLLRGYLANGPVDHLSHAAYGQDLVRTGHVSAGDFYPATHVLVAQLSLATGLDPLAAANLPGPAFFALAILVAGAAGLAVGTPSGARVAAALAAFPAAYYYGELFPMGYSAILLALALVLLLRAEARSEAASTALFAVLAVALVFYHPITAALLAALAGVVALLTWPFSARRRVSPAATLAILAGLATWVWVHVRVWRTAVTSVVQLAALEAKEGITGAATGARGALGLTLLETVEVGVRIYGALALLGLLAFAGWLLAFRAQPGEGPGRRRFRVAFLCACAVVVFLWVSDYVFPLTSLSSGRMAWVALPFLCALGGPGAWALARGWSARRRALAAAAAPAVALLLAGTWLLAAGSVAPSPATMRPNVAVTPSQFDAYEWLFTRSANDTPVYGAGIQPPQRFAHAVLGQEAGRLRLFGQQETLVEDHFGYEDPGRLDPGVPVSSWIVVRPRFLVDVYGDLWRNVGRFSAEDLARLDGDPAAQRLYDDGDTFLVQVARR